MSDLAALPGVSRETALRLQAFAELLLHWQRATNLIGPATIGELWQRHIADSAELTYVAPHARHWLDLGSGAGFPGLVVAILLGADGRVDLVESNGKKAAFLRAAAAATGAPAVVHGERAEAVVARLAADGRLPDAISARGLAPLDALLGLIAPLSAQSVPAYFHKGVGFAGERDAAAARWRFDLVEHRSRFGPGVIAEIRKARPADIRERRAP